MRGIGYIGSVEDIRRTVLKARDGTPVMVGDVAEIVQSNTPRRGAVGWNEQKEAVEGFVLMRRGENPTRVLEGMHAKVAELNAKILPKGMQIVPFYDRTLLVGNTLHTVNTTCCIGSCWWWPWRGSFSAASRGSLIVAAVIPLALLGAFIGLYVLGMPANLISMGAIDFGILVDGAVVLVENVLHALQHERPPTRREVLRLVDPLGRVDVARPTLFAMAHHHRRADAGVHAAAGRGPHLPPARADLHRSRCSARWCSRSRWCRRCARLASSAAGSAPSRAGSRRRGCATAAGSAACSARGRRCSPSPRRSWWRASFWRSRLGTEFLPELDEGDFVVFVEMPP